MWSATTRVSNPQPGDLVFFNTSGSGVSHAGIYLGNNQFIHSGSSTGVAVASMNSSYWGPRYLGAGRVR
jgi:cell wall-associated NlpC family hydrolase